MVVPRANESNGSHVDVTRCVSTARQISRRLSLGRGTAFGSNLQKLGAHFASSVKPGNTPFSLGWAVTSAESTTVGVENRSVAGTSTCGRGDRHSVERTMFAISRTLALVAVVAASLVPLPGIAQDA